jgi:uncharacterized protein (DUF1697 family)
MATRIALLRGINVLGRNRLPMKDLVRIMQANGYAKVRTYIQSGNVLFDGSARKATKLGELIENEFGFRPGVFLLDAADLENALQKNPFHPREGKHLHFFFFDRAPESVDFALLDSVKTDTESYHLAESIFYLHAPDGIGRSRLATKLGRAFLGVSMTARNLNTMQRLDAMLKDQV